MLLFYFIKNNKVCSLADLAAEKYNKNIIMTDQTIHYCMLVKLPGIYESITIMFL